MRSSRRATAYYPVEMCARCQDAPPVCYLRVVADDETLETCVGLCEPCLKVVEKWTTIRLFITARKP